MAWGLSTAAAGRLRASVVPVIDGVRAEGQHLSELRPEWKGMAAKELGCLQPGCFLEPFFHTALWQPELLRAKAHQPRPRRCRLLSSLDLCHPLCLLDSSPWVTQIGSLFFSQRTHKCLRNRPSLDALGPAQSYQDLPFNAADTHGTAQNVSRLSTALPHRYI